MKFILALIVCSRLRSNSVSMSMFASAAPKTRLPPSSLMYRLFCMSSPDTMQEYCSVSREIIRVLNLDEEKIYMHH